MPTLREVFVTLARSLRVPGAGWALLAIATYKTGESLIDPMFSAFLIDADFAREDLGLWLGTYGMAASIAGSIAGGLLASRISLPRALLVAGLLRALPLAGELLLAVHGAPSASAVIATTIAEHFFGGALTTAMFAFMMWRVDRRVGASHYTLLAAIEVLGKTPFSLASGFVAERFGYVSTFAFGLALSVLWVVLVARAPLASQRAATP